MFTNSKNTLVKSGLILLLLLPALTACTVPGGPGPDSTNQNSGGKNPGKQGNASGYGLTRNISVTLNETKEFQLEENGNPISEVKIIDNPSSGTVRLGAATGTYRPKLNFVGLDKFKFEYLDQQGTKANVEVFVDVAPCFRKNGLPDASNLQVVSVYEGGDDDHNDDQPGNMDVVIEKTTTPITLVLANYRGVRWNLILKEGAELESVLVQTFDLPTTSVVGVPADVPVVKRSGWYAYSWKEAQEFQRFMQEIRRYFLKNETAYQGCYGGYKATIPYTAQSLYELCGNSYGASFYSFKNQDCSGMCTVQNSGEAAWSSEQKASTITLSNDNLTAEITANSYNDGILGTEKKRCGKWYFEVNAESLNVFEALGLSSERINLELLNYTNFYGFSLGFSLVTGDQIGIAADLDAGAVYLRRNGVWLKPDPNNMFWFVPGGDPEQQIGGIPLSLYYETYYPAAVLSQRTKFTANFGRLPFANPMPTGFKEWFKQ